MPITFEKFTTKISTKLLNYESKHSSRNQPNDKLYFLRYKNYYAKTWK